jgi:uncharacterized membrane protein (UPF0127 family)
MQLFNKTKNIILAKDIVLADTPFKRMKGLLGRKGLREGEGLAIIPRLFFVLIWLLNFLQVSSERPLPPKEILLF